MFIGSLRFCLNRFVWLPHAQRLSELIDLGQDFVILLDGGRFTDDVSKFAEDLLHIDDIRKPIPTRRLAEATTAKQGRTPNSGL